MAEDQDPVATVILSTFVDLESALLLACPESSARMITINHLRMAAEWAERALRARGKDQR